MITKDNWAKIRCGGLRWRTTNHEHSQSIYFYPFSPSKNKPKVVDRVLITMNPPVWKFIFKIDRCCYPERLITHGHHGVNPMQPSIVIVPPGPNAGF